MKQKEGIKEGIYFNLSNEDYHNDPAISCSGVKLLLENPKKYWHSSPLNPNKEPLDTAALKLGKLYHNLLLEPEKFGDEFLVLPKGKLTKSYLKESGLEEADIAHLVVLREDNIKVANEAINELKEEKLYKDWFTGGYVEVSIFWRDKGTGLMCRARFDYLKPRFAIDYKTTADITDLKKAVANFNYNLQSTIYQVGLKALIGKDDIHVEGNDEQKEWVKTLAKNEDFDFRFLFQEKVAPYISRSTTLACDILNPSIVLFKTALNIYLINLQRYGLKKWGSGYDKVEEIKATDMPVYWNMKMEEQTEKRDELPF